MPEYTQREASRVAGRFPGSTMAAPRRLRLEVWSVMDVYLEIAKRRAFVGAVAWAGRCSSGRDEYKAFDALPAYGKRYEAAISRARLGFKPTSSFTIVERLTGGPITDFGAPEARPKADSRQ